MAVTMTTRARAWLGGLAKSMQFPVSGRWLWSAWSTPAYRDYTFDRLAHEGYRLNAAVNICVQKLAINYQQAPLIIKDRGQLVLNTPLGALLNKPNDLMSWHELAIFIQVYKAIGGACRLHKVRDERTNDVLELWPYHIGQIAAVPGEYQWIDHYTTTGEELKQIPVEDIIDLHWPSVDPRSPWEALPPLMSVAREVDTDSEATRYMYALLFNDAVPMTVIKTKNQLKDSQFERLRAQFEQRHGGSNRGRVAVIEQDAEITRMALNLEEMAFEAMRHVPEARIAAEFGVPAMYSGLNVGLAQSTYNNMSEARRGFFEDTIVPQAVLDDGEITRSLADDFPGDLTVHRAWNQVAALQDNMDALYKRVGDTYKAGITMRNEARMALSLPAVEDLKPPPGAPPLPSGWEFATQQPTIPPELLPDMQQHSVSSVLVKALRYKATSATEKRMQRALQSYLEAEYEKAASEAGT